VVAPSGRIIYGNAAGQQLWGGARYIGIDGFDQFKGWWLESGRPIAIRFGAGEDGGSSDIWFDNLRVTSVPL